MMRFAIVGFGEVGGIFARDLLAGGAEGIVAWDTAPAARERAAAMAGVTPAASAEAAAGGADVVFVCVTAGSVDQAMAALAGTLGHRPFVVDVNSIAPAAKIEAGRTVSAAGGRYVEAAVMASVPPKGLRTPMLLGGPDAPDFAAAMAPWAMDLTVFSPGIGRASSVKMCRSVMVKGLEALTTECMLAARHYGVEDDVLRSLSDTLPHEDWRGLARYVIGRALIHGKRRSEEMREVARTVAEAGVEPLLSRAITERQDWAWRRGREMAPDALASPELATMLDGLARTMADREAAD